MRSPKITSNTISAPLSPALGAPPLPPRSPFATPEEPNHTPSLKTPLQSLLKRSASFVKGTKSTPSSPVQRRDIVISSPFATSKIDSTPSPQLKSKPALPPRALLPMLDDLPLSQSSDCLPNTDTDEVSFTGSRPHSKSSPAFPSRQIFNARPRSSSDPAIRLPSSIVNRDLHRVTVRVCEPEVKFASVVFKIAIDFNKTNWIIHRNYKEFKHIHKKLTPFLAKFSHQQPNIRPFTFPKVSKDAKKSEEQMMSFYREYKFMLNSFMTECCRVFNRVLSVDTYAKEKSKFFTFIGPYHKNDTKRFSQQMPIPIEIIDSYVQMKSSQDLNYEEKEREQIENPGEMSISVDQPEIKFNHMMYKVTVEYQGVSWTIFRRFKQFMSIHSKIHHLIPSENQLNVKLPSKKQKLSEEFFESHRGDFNLFVNGCCASLDNIVKNKKEKIEFFKFIGPYCYGDVKRFSVAIPLAIF